MILHYLCLQTKKKLHQFWNERGREDLSKMHMCRTEVQFRHMSALIMEKWCQLGKDSYSKWFNDTYLHPHWYHWWSTALAPGVLANNNPLESSNNADKTIMHNIRVSLDSFLNMKTPELLAHYATNAGGSRNAEPQHRSRWRKSF